jgi:hypothetical protein
MYRSRIDRYPFHGTSSLRLARIGIGSLFSPPAEAVSTSGYDNRFSNCAGQCRNPVLPRRIAAPQTAAAKTLVPSFGSVDCDPFLARFDENNYHAD